MSDKLKRWLDEKPDEGRFINLYRSNSDHAVFCRAVQYGFFVGIKPSIEGAKIPSGDEMWCYVPAPPDWDAVQTKRRAETILRSIAYHESEIEKLNAERDSPLDPEEVKP